MAKKATVADLPTDEELAFQRRQLMEEGVQRLGEAIDLLLPALIEIELGELSAREMAAFAKNALKAFEAKRGQRLNRMRYMQSREIERTVSDAEGLHAKRMAT